MQKAEIKSLLRTLQLAPSKLRGQNFLCDQGALREIVSFASIPPATPVIEVGPGLGVLTRALLEAHRVCAVEIDRGFARYLRESIASEAFFLLEQDATKLQIDQLEFLARSPTPFLIGNIPYSISSSLLQWAVSQRDSFIAGTFLVQREFARRVAATEGSRTYGSLSVFASMYFELSLGPEIPGTCFYPETKVVSQLIRFVPRRTLRVNVSSAVEFEQFVRGLFAHKRKNLLNNFCRFYTEFSKEEVEALFSEAEIDPRLRAEALSIEQFARLFGKAEARQGEKS